MTRSNTKKVLIICPFASPNLGGVETHIDKLISYAVKKGNYVVLLTYQPLTRNVKGKPFESGKNFEIHRLSWFGIGWFHKLEAYFPLVFLYLFLGLFMFSLKYYLQNYKDIKVIHAHGLASAAITKILKSIHPVKTIVSTHAVYSLKTKPVLGAIIKWVLSSFDKVLAVSEVSRSELADLGISSDRLVVHPNWVDTSVFKPVTKKSNLKKLKIKTSFNVLFVGRLIEKKGIKVIIEALPLFDKSVGVHIIGSGPMESDIKAAEKQYKNLKFYGALMQDNKKDFERLILLYNSADYLVSPYSYDEGFSATLIESVACGTPVIVSRRGSPPQFLSIEVAEFLSPNPSSQELSNKISELLGKKDTFNRRKICREFALKHFGFKNADIIVNNY